LIGCASGIIPLSELDVNAPLLDRFERRLEEVDVEPVVLTDRLYQGKRFYGFVAVMADQVGCRKSASLPGKGNEILLIASTKARMHAVTCGIA
jgi:hypothetical protein